MLANIGGTNPVPCSRSTRLAIQTRWAMASIMSATPSLAASAKFERYVAKLDYNLTKDGITDFLCAAS